MSNKLSMLSKKATGGGGGDVTTTTDFTEYVAYPATTLESTQQTIADIDTTITLRFDILYTDMDNFEYVKNNGAGVPITNGSTFTVVNGDKIYFRWNNGSLFLTAYVEIYNTSDSNAFLGSINFDAT